jgi:hypothetical protein
MADLTEVHGLTFEVPRDKVLGMIDAKIAFLKRAASAWAEAAADEAYLEAQTAEERKKAVDKAKAEGIPPQMAQAAMKKDALVKISLKNVRTMQAGAAQWQVQRDYLSQRPVFTLTQEQIVSLAVDDADKMFPPDWKGVTAS